VAVYQSQLDQAKASGDNNAIADAATSLKSALDELKSLTDAQGADVAAFLAALRGISKGFGSNITSAFAPSNVPKFATGGFIEGPKGSPQLIEGHAGEFVLRQDGKNLKIEVKESQGRPNVTQHLYFKVAPESQRTVQRYALNEAMAAV
jgi:hypothetical protein